MNYTKLFLKAIIFAFVVLLLKGLLGSVANAEEKPKIIWDKSGPANCMVMSGKAFEECKALYIQGQELGFTEPAVYVRMIYKQRLDAIKSHAIEDYVREHQTPRVPLSSSPTYVAPPYHPEPMRFRDDSPVPVFILNK